MAEKSLVSINKYLKKLVAHLKKASENDPYKIIIEAFLGIRKPKLEETILIGKRGPRIPNTESLHGGENRLDKTKPSPFGKRAPRLRTEEKIYKREFNTLKKYGLVTAVGGKLSIDDRFHTVLRTKKYRWVSLLSKQRRNDLERQLKKTVHDQDVIDAILDNLDNKVPIRRSWEKTLSKKNDKSILPSYSTFRRKVEKAKKNIGF